MNYEANNKIIELTSVELTKARNAFNNIQLKANSKLSEIISDLTGVQSITTEINSESTQVYINYGKFGMHEISIYHRKPYSFKSHSYGKEIQFEISWFSTSHKFNEENKSNGLVDYLNVLGLIANSINNDGIIKEHILSSIESFEAPRKEYRNLENIISQTNDANNTIIKNIKAAEVHEALQQDEIEIKEISYSLNRRNSVKTNCVRIVKQTKKMTHFELKETYTEYLKDDNNEYKLDENNNYITEQRQAYRGSISKLSHDAFTTFISHYWPKSFDDYKQEFEAKLISK